MRVRQAFPQVLERRYPTVKPDYSLLTVLYLLRMQDVDAVPISPLAQKSPRAVFGYSTLPRMVNMAPKEFEQFLNGPCVEASSELAAVKLDDDLEDLLRAFDSKKLGFAVVRATGPARASLVTLADFLGLYAKGALRTTLTARQVASKVVPMPGSTTIREALKAMIARRQRRVFISGKGTFVSDRSIMHHLFSPMILEDVTGKEDVLSEPIDRIEQLSPARVKPTASLPTAAKALLKDRGGCLTAGEGTVVTPWDLVMKAWKVGALHWGGPGRRG